MVGWPSSGSFGNRGAFVIGRDGLGKRPARLERGALDFHDGWVSFFHLLGIQRGGGIGDELAGVDNEAGRWALTKGS